MCVCMYLLVLDKINLFLCKIIDGYWRYSDVVITNSIENNFSRVSFTG